MNVTDAIAQRRSVRAFKDTPLDEALIKEIFTKAQLAPSNCNTQPWRVSVVSGEARQRLEDAFVKLLMARSAPTTAFKPGDDDLKGVYRERQIDCAVQLFEAAGVTREDKLGRQMLGLQNWRFFGAPHAAFISMPLSMGETNALDVGIYLQTLMLLMTEAGVACCPQGALAHHPGPVKEIANIPDGYGIICGLSFGYADNASPLNQFPLGRAALNDTVEFVE